MLEVINTQAMKESFNNESILADDWIILDRPIIGSITVNRI